MNGFILALASITTTVCFVLGVAFIPQKRWKESSIFLLISEVILFAWMQGA